MNEINFKICKVIGYTTCQSKISCDVDPSVHLTVSIKQSMSGTILDFENFRDLQCTFDTIGTDFVQGQTNE
jgi:hypothetical protein